MKKIVFGIFLFLGLQEIFAQTFTSQDNRTQVWTDNATWGTTPPASNPITGTVNIYGNVSLTGNFSVANNGVATLNAYDTLNISGSATNNRVFNVIAGGIVTIDGSFTNSNSGAVLDVYGTLIVKGNFTANSTVRIRPGGILIIVGDLTMPNAGPSIINEGQTVVVGEVNMQGGSIQTGNQFYIFDDAPTYNNSSPSVDGVTYNGSNGGALTSEFPTESSIPPPIWDILDGLGVSCAGSNSISGAQTICNNSVPAGLSGTSLGSVTYLWESSTTSATAGFSTAAGTSNNQNYVPGSLTQTTWYRRRITKASPSCTHYSTAIEVTVFNGSVWTGANNFDFTNSANWCGGVPTASIDAYIPAGKPRYPNQNSIGVKDMTIESGGASITIASNQNVTVNGNLINRGTIFLANSATSVLNLYGNVTNSGALTFSSTTAGTVAFLGTTQQTVTGGPYTFPNMTVNSGSNQVVFSSSVTINRVFTFVSGIINMSGSTLTLGTASNNDTNAGTLAYTDGRIANGTFTRYVANGAKTAFRFPMGTTSDNRPFYFTTTSGITGGGGTMSVTHTGATTTTTGLSITDGGSIQNRQDSYWTVASNIGGGTLSIFAGGTGFGTVGNLTHLRLMRANAAIPSSTHVNSTGPSTTDFIAQRNGLSLATLTGGALYIGSIDPVVTPLPIKLISFTSNQQPDGILLKWITSKEENFDYFLLERAGSDLNFQSITTIIGKGGLDVTTNYDHLDNTPLLGKNYYRLKSVDLDGTFEYSTVIVAEWDGKSGGITIYPNPVVNHTLTVALNDKVTMPTLLTLCDARGYVVFETVLDASTTIINLPETLGNGVYLASVGHQTIRVVVK